MESPNALLIIPSPEKAKDISKSDRQENSASETTKDMSKPAQPVIAVVRFIRTAERRRAKFLREEQDRLSRVVSTLQWLVPAWAKQDEYALLEAAWRKESLKHFPEELQDLLWKLIRPWTNDRGSMEGLGNGSEEDGARSRLNRLRNLAEKVPAWVLGDGDEPPAQSIELDVEEVWAVLLGRFLYKLNHTQSNTTMVDIVGQTIRGLLRLHWEPFGAYKHWIKRLNQLEAFESVLSEIPRYRDHSVHQFQVYLIGLLILSRLKDEGIVGLEIFEKRRPGSKNEEEGKEQDSRPWRASEDLRAWTLAAFFHDVAYPLQKVPEWANLFGRALTSTQDAEFVRGESPTVLLDQVQGKPASKKTGASDSEKTEASDSEKTGASDSEKKKASCSDETIAAGSNEPGRFVLPRDTLVNAIFKQIFDAATESQCEPKNGLEEEVSGAVRAEVNRLLESWDHGVWAALVLLDTSGNSKEIVEAAVAIALHNDVLSRLEEKIRSKCCGNGHDSGAKPLELRFRLEQKETALSSLLLLCDALHEWGREFRQGSRVSDKIERSVRRPTLRRLAWLETNEGERTLRIDIDLGTEATGDQLLYKVRELEGLAAILDPGPADLQVRVSTIDPEKLDPAAVPVHTITFDGRGGQ